MRYSTQGKDKELRAIDKGSFTPEEKLLLKIMRYQYMMLEARKLNVYGRKS